MALKIRNSAARPPPLGYPMSACMSLLGGTWTPNVIWQLNDGTRLPAESPRQRCDWQTR
jgi:DNA-binding HxlR family transcriptional regulator